MTTFDPEDYEFNGESGEELGHHAGDESRPEHEWFDAGNLRDLVARLKSRIQAVEDRQDFRRDGRPIRVLIIPLDWEEESAAEEEE